jgi:sulfur-oxidizing protein SoxY
MDRGPVISRRRLLASGFAAAGVAAATAGTVRPAGAQITDLRGLDPLWRDAEDAIRAFFPRVTFRHEGLEMDLPQHAEVGGSVPVTVRVASAMTQDDHPTVVHLVAHGNPTPHILSAWFTPAGGRAEFSTRIRLERSQTVSLVAGMRDGRHLRLDRDVSVSFGACAQIGTGNDDDVAAFRPQTRVSVQPTAARGAIVPIRALISHPMETGLRLGPTDEWVRQRIISRFTCGMGGQEIFRARLYPAVATNPYFQFFARAERSGTFDFDWYDTHDVTFENHAKIDVA